MPSAISKKISSMKIPFTGVEGIEEKNKLPMNPKTYALLE
jgi:hypothetical protein